MDETVGPVALRSLAARFPEPRARRLDVPSEGMAIVGENGHGKTNLLEAIYYLQLLRSVRGARDQDVVRFGAHGFHIAATSSSAGAHYGDRRVSSAAGKRKRVRSTASSRRG